MKNITVTILFFLSLNLTLSAVEFIAHRGASDEAPENTLAAFNLAWQQEPDAIEGDFYCSKDGKIVCFHDLNLKRITGVNQQVTDCTFEYLQTLDVGSWKGEKWKGCKIPLIQEVLATIPKGKKIVIEIKGSKDLVYKLAEILSNSNLQPSKVTIITSKPELILLAKKILSKDIKCLLIIGLEEKNNTLIPNSNTLIKSAKECNADGISCNAPDLLNPDYIQNVKNSGLSFHVWTIDDVDQAKKLIRMGVNSITSNIAGKLKKELK